MALLFMVNSNQQQLQIANVLLSSPKHKPTTHSSNTFDVNIPQNVEPNENYITW
jgi:hypothetical protein